MAINTGIIFVWSGTHAGIPSGWERVTALDGKYPKGTANNTNPNQSGGNATHEHSATANHEHADNGHTHTITTGGISTYNGRGGTNSLGNHTHGAFTSGARVGGGLSSVASVYSAISNDPPYHEVIFVTPSTNKSALPNEMVAFSDDISFANNTGKWLGFYKCDGNNSTPNLHDKYLKGAGTGQNAGGTGGSLTNVHPLTHTHTVATHTHADATSNGRDGSRDADVWGGVQSGSYGNSDLLHTHVVALTAIADTISSATPQLTTVETVEPAHTKLMPIQNRAGKDTITTGIIGMYLGTLGFIPRGWTLCDGNRGTVDMRGRHLKMTATGASIGDTGGANTHTHSNDVHTHTSTGHTNGYTITAHPNWTDYGSGMPYTSTIATIPSSLHAVTVGSATTTYANGTTSADSQNNEPSYVTVAFVKYTKESSGGFMFL